MEIKWLRESLFAGMTTKAFKLGTVLTLGWFWTRISGCSVLYRGESMETIDLATILAVTDANTSKISPPAYVQHNNSSTYFYVIRRVNNCGVQEQTLGGAIKVSMDTNGELTQPQPNDIFESRAEQAAGDKVQLFWYYCPIEQKAEPVRFNVYYDGGAGQINYQNPIATIDYVGRVYYNYQSNVLDAGKYLFAVRPEGVDGTENSSLAPIKIQLNTTSPDAIDILSAETV
ncbi:MAG: hypothetical protein ACYS1A_03015 [Planctomycetota bacterium]|jgi:hypothetical protein